jgi:hypothetical protein
MVAEAFKNWSMKLTSTSIEGLRAAARGVWRGAEGLARLADLSIL